MTSGGARNSSGPPPDPNSLASLKRDWVMLPAAGYSGPIPEWPLDEFSSAESAYWSLLWRKPQAVKWFENGLVPQVAAYCRVFIESTQPGALAGLKTVARQLDNELGISIAAMLSLGWKISVSDQSEVETPGLARQTSSGSWLKSVAVTNP